MKTIFTCLIFLLTLSASTCRREALNCHYDIEFKNVGNDTVIYALKFTSDQATKCVLQGDSVIFGKSIKQNLKYCWEEELVSGKAFEFYLVDPKKYNQPNIFYPCDSIEINNKVLKHFVLTLEDLKRTNFTISYP